MRVEEIARRGATPLVVAEGRHVLGVIELKDIVKAQIKERFAELRRMGIRTVMITGDNRLTAASIAAEAGVDDFLAEATPEAKLKLIRDIQAEGKLVAMTGDGTNDAPALAQADVAVVMNSGTQAAKEAGNMVDLDSNPTKLIEIVEIGKQLLMTRGSLTTFSIANDVAKYFAIIPAAFASTYPALGALNVMHLATPASAILSAVIFNALVIPALIPLALKGVTLPRGRRGAGAAPEHADLRRRRHPAAVRRHQAHRHAARRRRTSPEHQEDTSCSPIFFPALRMLVVLTVLTGVAYPLLVTGIAQVAFPARRQRQPDRSRRQGRRLRAHRPAVRRPEVLLEPPFGDVAAALQRERVLRLQPGRAQSGARRRGRGAHQGAARCRSGGRAPVPADLVTASASGLDPHISVAAAEYQVRASPRPAAAAGRQFARSSRETPRRRTFGLLGERASQRAQAQPALDRGARK